MEQGALSWGLVCARRSREGDVPGDANSGHVVPSFHKYILSAHRVPGVMQQQMPPSPALELADLTELNHSIVSGRDKCYDAG